MTPRTATAPLLEEPADVQPQALMPAPTVTMFERLASDPNVDVEKLERLMALFERGEARKAETAFNAAMSAAQQEMRPVAADAENPQSRSRYASYEALDRELRPIYTRHGFALSFNTGDAPQAEYVRVLCDVTHLGGHGKVYRADMPADGKGAKGGDVMTKTHAVGSAMSYGMRYLLKMVFNVAVGEEDDDGNRAARTTPDVKAPEGFQSWWAVFEPMAEQGLSALMDAWNKSKPEYRNHMMKTNKRGWDALKAQAEKVGK